MARVKTVFNILVAMSVDTDRLCKMITRLVETDRATMEVMCMIGYALLDVRASMEKLESKAEMTSDEYLSSSNYLKFQYDFKQMGKDGLLPLYVDVLAEP